MDSRAQHSGGIAPRIMSVVITMTLAVYVGTNVINSAASDTEAVEPIGNPFGQAMIRMVEAVETVANLVVDATFFLGKLWVGTVAFLLGIWLMGRSVDAIRSRNRHSVTDLGERKRTTTEEPSEEQERERCVNCSKEIGSDGVINVATRNLVAFGIVLRERYAVEIPECRECHEADWFTYAMRSGEKDHVLTDPDALGAVDGDGEPDQSAPDKVECPRCDDGPFHGQHGLSVHIGKKHSEEEDTTQHPESMEHLRDSDQ